MLKYLAIFCALIFALPAVAATQRTAETLPALDLSCFQSYLVTFDSDAPEISLDGDSLKKPRFQLKSVYGQTLKVIENPTDPQRRTEYGKAAYEIFTDFGGNAPIYGWREEGPDSTRIFSFRVDDKILSVLDLATTPKTKLDMLRVLKCQ
jgi:hypothetical protein